MNLVPVILKVENRYGRDCWMRTDHEFVNDPDVLTVRAVNRSCSVHGKKVSLSGYNDTSREYIDLCEDNRELIREMDANGFGLAAISEKIKVPDFFIKNFCTDREIPLHFNRQNVTDVIAGLRAGKKVSIIAKECTVGQETVLRVALEYGLMDTLPEMRQEYLNECKCIQEKIDTIAQEHWDGVPLKKLARDYNITYRYLRYYMSCHGYALRDNLVDITRLVKAVKSGCRTTAAVKRKMGVQSVRVGVSLKKFDLMYFFGDVV